MSRRGSDTEPIRRDPAPASVPADSELGRALERAQALLRWQRRAMGLLVRINQAQGDRDALRGLCAEGQGLVDEGLRVPPARPKEQR